MYFEDPYQRFYEIFCRDQSTLPRSVQKKVRMHNTWKDKEREARRNLFSWEREYKNVLKIEKNIKKRIKFCLAKQRSIKYDIGSTPINGIPLAMEHEDLSSETDSLVEEIN
jgi:hypothetical protein